MKTPIIVLSVLALVAGTAALAPRLGAEPPASRAPSPEVQGLRELGPAGLAKALGRLEAGTATEAEVDAVAGQFGARWSRLYWYTDLDQAKAAARAEGKPILYLRLLGKLTDEYSCANSRFFRTVLYANDAVSGLLREKFVLVWGTERPVPVLTIDYGDGRVVKRTVTGNSVHYVLTPAGEVVDVLPGLIDPVSFGRLAAEAGAAALGDPAASRVYVTGALAKVQQELARDLALAAAARTPATPDAAPTAPTAREAAGLAMSKGQVERGAVQAIVPPAPPSPAAPAPAAPAAQQAKAPDAEAAGRAAMGKRMVERPLTRAAAAEPPPAVEPEVAWAPLARVHAADAALDANSLRLMRAQNPGLDEAAMGRLVARFQEAVALDTARDLYDFRRRILGWLAEAPEIGLEDLNRRVYAELFLTPRSDPWLGLVPADTYSALGNDGVCRAPAGR